MGNFLSLDNLKKEESATILSLNDNLGLGVKRRLLELGLVPGYKIKLCNLSFMGNVILIEINGYLLSIRKNIAKQIIVKSLKG